MPSTLIPNRKYLAVAAAIAFSAGTTLALQAADQTTPGAGNATAIATSGKSAMVASSRNYLVNQASKLRTASLYGHTLDILTNNQHCIQHRAFVTDAQKNGIVQALLAQGLVAANAGDNITGGIKAGVFPAVVNDGSACPMNPQPFTSAPGSDNGSHHSFPGGLIIHTQNNEESASNFSNLYNGSYGTPAAGGLPVVDHSASRPATDLQISADIMIAAPIWHDWAKMMVFQWNADGTEFTELKFGGAGVTDNYGAAGTSVTGGHHIIGIAETIARGLPPEFIITQASAHASPALGNEFEVVNWIRAASIIAQVDPVRGGYLITDAKGNFRLPPFRSLGDYNLNAQNQTNLLVEYQLHNLSDADFTMSIPAIGEMDLILAQVSNQFGYTNTDLATYNNKFRNVVYANQSAERLHMIYENKGLAGVVAELMKLRTAGTI